MGIIAPPVKSGEKHREVKPSKSFLSDALSAKSRQLVATDTGMVTAAQAMAERLMNIAIYAESNADAIAAQKLIYDRLQGKAAVIKQDDSRPMPKVVFALTEEGLDKINDSRDSKILEIADVEDDGSGLVIAEDEDGKIFVG